MFSKEISPDMLFKHPLEHTWSFWYYENNKEKSWEENQKEVTSFNTVEDFWWYAAIFVFLLHLIFDRRFTTLLFFLCRFQCRRSSFVR